MDRRVFLSTSIAPALAGLTVGRPDDFRAQFPMLDTAVYLNMASMAPMGRFASEGLRRGMSFQELGPGDGRGQYIGEVRDSIRGRFASLIGAQEAEIGLVHCTKAGEQIAIDGVMDRLVAGGNIVTNDLHFSGSLHNLVGLRRQGLDIRIVRAENWRVSADRMIGAIDSRTALVCVSLVSNINGHLEDVRPVAAAAHDRGALVYADIIQAAGAIPFNVHDLGIDVAACSCYKHLMGIHGSGFLFVDHAVQGTAIPDRLFPGHLNHQYAPWSGVPADEPYSYSPPVDATRYQPGHVNYIGYCATWEALDIIQRTGPTAILEHASTLNRRLIDQLPTRQFRCITPQPDRVGIAAFLLEDPDDAFRRMSSSDVVVTLSGNRMRVAPALFNTEDDVDRLVQVLTE